MASPSMLGHTPVTALGEEPERWIVFIHGILGKRANWRGIAKRFVATRPDWGALLIDLRMHGDSVGFDPPHTVAAAAADLVPVVATLGAPVDAVVGHSFGGKVALAYLQHATHKPKQMWTLDSAPGALAHPTESQAAGVLRFLKAAPKRYSEREEFIDHATGQGLSRGVATWLAMNLRREDPNGFCFALDLDAIESLMRDYAAQDYWPLIESLGPEVDVHLVIAKQSKAYSDEERQHATELAASNSHVHVHHVDAGHWLHVEEPEQLVQLLAAGSGNGEQEQPADHKKQHHDANARTHAVRPTGDET
jgi:esterase